MGSHILAVIGGFILGVVLLMGVVNDVKNQAVEAGVMTFDGTAYLVVKMEEVIE